MDLVWTWSLLSTDIQPFICSKIVNIGNNGKGTCDAGSGTHCWQRKNGTLKNNCILSVVSDIWLKPILGCGSTIESQLSIALTLHENPDDKCTHTPSPEGVPAKRS
jgi:hypothetical protein